MSFVRLAPSPDRCHVTLSLAHTEQQHPACASWSCVNTQMTVFHCKSMGKTYYICI